MNHSFSIIAGAATYHLKISDDQDSVDGLRQWYELRHVLEDRFRAPAVIEWVELGEIGFAGLLMEHVEGRAPELSKCPALFNELIEWADSLHRDEDIRKRLLPGFGNTYLDCFAGTYIERFRADLSVIAETRPPFVAQGLIEWMQEEVTRLAMAANGITSSHDTARETIHGDLHQANVIVTPNSWFVVDWDDLTIGDPMIDFAVLLWPLVWAGGEWRDYLQPTRDSAQRLENCFRAQLLDEVIDPLADYIEARAVPSREAEVKAVKQRRHEEALDRYRIVWG